MALAGGSTHTDALAALGTLGASLRAADGSNQLDRLHKFLSESAPESVVAQLEAARSRAMPIIAAAGHSETSIVIAAHAYAADVLVSLAAEGDLDSTDTKITAGALAETCSIPLPAAEFDLFQRAASSPRLRELPPVVAAEIQLRLLLHLDVVSETSLWRKSGDGEVRCVIALGADAGDRQLRNEARAAITGRPGIRLVRRPTLRSATVYRFEAATGAIVARVHGDPRRDISAYLDAAAASLAPLLERELLLERDSSREHALVTSVENRLTRLGFDLHDGPSQDILVLGAETKRLRDQVYPFVLESHRELARGRFDDLIARIVDLDRQLRETAHSLETRSVTSRPLAEILHREVDAFTLRTDINASLAVHGDPESLSQQQRIALFRAMQECLSNAREHSGATTVAVRLQMRRNAVEMRVTDNGHGFDVNRSLALAAERGRLGMVGIAERMRMLGGTFDVESRPGGPTTIRFSLPRWEPFQPITGGRH